MDITMIGLQNAGKTSLLRVLAVSFLKIILRCISYNEYDRGENLL